LGGSGGGVVMYYPAQAFKFFIEQHMENVMKANNLSVNFTSTAI